MRKSWLGYPKTMRGSAGRACTLACILVLLSTGSALASSGGTPTPGPISRTDAQGLDQMLTLLPVEYAGADPSHEIHQAAVVRLIARELRLRLLALERPLTVASPTRAAGIQRMADRLNSMLLATRVRLQPWPLSLEVGALAGRLQSQLRAITAPPPAPSHRYQQIDSALEEATRLASEGQRQLAAFATVRAFALYGNGPGRRLAAQDATLNSQITAHLAVGTASSPSLLEMTRDGAPAAAIAHTSAKARSQLGIAEEVLGEVHISRATIVANAAIIVFREGLEAVLILAAITASFVGAKRHLRRPVLLGALAGLAVTAVTWVLAELILHSLDTGGLELQAITGLIAIGVLLLVTNWFFHRVYWSEWISRFNRRRRVVERWSTFGFVSGQALGLALLGLSSVYREGLETVLFLQALETSAGAGATVLGAGIGLAATMIVGALTFKMQRRLPFKRMLVVTGALIALVLAVMVGTTVHNLQAIGWVSTTPTPFPISNSWSMWLGIYPTWQGLAAQTCALVFVVGSYIAAREIRVKRPQRRARAGIKALASPPAAPGTSA